MAQLEVLEEAIVENTESIEADKGYKSPVHRASGVL